MGLKAELLARLSFTQSGSPDIGANSYSGEIEHILKFVTGTGAGQADLLFTDERSVAASTNDDIDLAGSLTGGLNTAVVLAEVCGLIIINAPKLVTDPANVSDLTIGLGTNPFLGFLGGTTPTIGPIKPGGFLMLGAGHASGLGTVGAGASDILRVANGSGGTAKYQIGVLGRSA